MSGFSYFKGLKKILSYYNLKELSIGALIGIAVCLVYNFINHPSMIAGYAISALNTVIIVFLIQTTFVIFRNRINNFRLWTYILVCLYAGIIEIAMSLLKHKEFIFAYFWTDMIFIIPIGLLTVFIWNRYYKRVNKKLEVRKLAQMEYNRLNKA
jgi:hypothetical protein